MKAVVVEPGAVANLALRDVAIPVPAAHEALIRVTAFSLNRGEIGFAASKSAGTPIGWDVAGVVERAAADGSGHIAGTRVVGWSKNSTGFGEYTCLAANYLAAIPDSVSDEVASCLPVAGLTALYVLERGERLLGQRVLITGSTGGVGHIAVQLARLMGAITVAQVRRPNQIDGLRALGADEVIVDQDGSLCGAAGPYQLIVESVGGGFATQALRGLGEHGVCVLFGLTMGASMTLSIRQFCAANFARVEGFTLYREDAIASPAAGLTRLLGLCAAGKLQVEVSVIDDWQRTAETARALIERRFTGKAVLRIR